MTEAPAELIDRILEETRSIAVVGLSANPEKESHQVASYLQAARYRIIPVNPTAREILGERVYPDLGSIPEEVDVVQVFRAEGAEGRRRKRGRFLAACATQSASHCGLLMIPMMLLVGATIVLNVAFDPRPIFLPLMLILFLGFMGYYYFRSYQACGRCEEAVKPTWRACPHCGDSLVEHRGG